MTDRINHKIAASALTQQFYGALNFVEIAQNRMLVCIKFFFKFYCSGFI